MRPAEIAGSTGAAACAGRWASLTAVVAPTIATTSTALKRMAGPRRISKRSKADHLDNSIAGTPLGICGDGSGGRCSDGGHTTGAWWRGWPLDQTHKLNV